jgi:hypothetical protein
VNGASGKVMQLGSWPGPAVQHTFGWAAFTPQAVTVPLPPEDEVPDEEPDVMLLIGSTLLLHAATSTTLAPKGESDSRRNERGMDMERPPEKGSTVGWGAEPRPLTRMSGWYGRFS